MDYLIFVLLFLLFMLLIVVHSDVIPWFNNYLKIISRVFPQVLHIQNATKTALTLSCLIIFIGVLGQTYTADSRWVVNAMIFSAIPLLIRWARYMLKK